MSTARLLTAVIASLALSSCATIGEETPAPGHDRVTAETVLHHSPLLAGADPVDYSGVDILEMTPEMKAFIDDYVQGAKNRYARMKRLVFAVMGDDRFELVYDDRTRTAAETFREQHGNCLSFTNLFIAMARYLDIHASYQEVDIPPDWSLAGESFLFSQHINVELDLGADVIRVVDFNNYDFDADFDRRIISDQRARAHYFSNLGVDYMLETETFLAVSNFLQALREDPEFVPAWINIGILHRREGFPDFAEAAWLKALEIDRFSLVAMSNLANLYEQEGRPGEAEYYANRVTSHRMSNPYYRYNLAQEAVMEGDYTAAIGHLKFAIRKRDKEDRFYSLLGVSYLLNGDEDNARKWMEKAEEIASADADKARYHNKLDRLMSQGMRRNGVQ
jgi:Flp pilus assembly protein TadD